MITIKELTEKLKKYPEDMEVVFDTHSSEFRYASCLEARVQKVGFCEEPDSKALAKYDVVVLSEHPV